MYSNLADLRRQVLHQLASLYQNSSNVEPIKVTLLFLAPKNTPEAVRERKQITKQQYRTLTIDGDTVSCEVFGMPLTGEGVWGHLKKLNALGYGAYLYVNPGGISEAEITEGVALFYEIDDLSKEQQWSKLRLLEGQLGIKATQVLETYKSLHCYFRLPESETELATWKGYQQRLIQKQESDPSIYNPNRLMRVAGFDHWRWDEKAGKLLSFPVRLAQLEDTDVDFPQWNEVLPDWDESRWGKKVRESHGPSNVDSPFDIRFMAQYLVGHNPDGRPGWTTAKCPAHNGESDNSLHINNASGAFKCHAGCDSKSVYNAVLEIAKRVAPEHYIQGEDYEANQAYNWLIRHLRPAKGVPVYNKNKVVKTAPKAEQTNAIVRYDDPINNRFRQLFVTPDTVPTVGEWLSLGRPVLFYVDRLSVWDQLIAKGFPFVVDESPAGWGKTTSAASYMHRWESLDTRAQCALLENGHEGDLLQWLIENKIYFFTSDYRNPSTEELESIPETVSGGGLVEDLSKPLKSGAPSRKRAKVGEKYDIPPLCKMDDVVQIARVKGASIYRGKKSKFCETCPFFHDCRYLREKENQEKEIALRSHLSKGGKGKVAFIDEASRSIVGEVNLRISASDLDKELGRIWADENILQGAKDLAKLIHKGLLKAIEEKGDHGLTHSAVLSFLPSQKTVYQSVFDIEFNHEFRENLDYWEPKRTTSQLAHFQDTDEILDGLTDAESRKKAVDELLQPGAIQRVIRILLGGRGILEITSYGKTAGLTIQDKSYRQWKTLNKFDTVICLDATPDYQNLTYLVGKPKKDIVSIRQAEQGDYSNLKITIIEGVGNLGRNRRSGGVHDVCSRLVMLASELAGRHLQDGPVGLLDSKYYVESLRIYETLETAFELRTGYNWLHNQSTNRFEDCNTLIAVNPKPLIHLTSAHTTYQTRFNGCSEANRGAFYSWLGHQGQHHLIQLVARLRAQHSSDTKRVYLISPLNTAGAINHADVFALSSHYPGAQIERVNVAEICPEAAPRVDQCRRKLIQAMIAKIEAGEKVSQPAIAKELGVGKSAVSMQLKRAGLGWKKFTAVINALYNKSELFDEASETLAQQLIWLNQAVPELLDAYKEGEITQVQTADGVIDLFKMTQVDPLDMEDGVIDSVHELFVQATPLDLLKTLVPYGCSA